MTIFEYDPAKSVANLKKHGIDFLNAQALWNDPEAVEVEAISENESRFIVVGIIDNKHWSAVVTYRNEVVRLISVRRSRDKEVEIYAS
jgi:hypothetical protein